MKIKKVAALALAAVMGASMLAGCASKSIDEDAVVVKMKDGEVRLGCRLIQIFRPQLLLHYTQTNTVKRKNSN